MRQSNYSVKGASFTDTPLTSSPYFRPRQVRYDQNGITKVWDTCCAHQRVSILIHNIDRDTFVLVKQFRPSVWASLQHESLFTPPPKPFFGGGVPPLRVADDMYDDDGSDHNPQMKNKNSPLPSSGSAHVPHSSSGSDSTILPTSPSFAPHQAETQGEKEKVEKEAEEEEEEETSRVVSRSVQVNGISTHHDKDHHHPLHHHLFLETKHAADITTTTTTSSNNNNQRHPSSSSSSVASSTTTSGGWSLIGNTISNVLSRKTAVKALLMAPASLHPVSHVAITAASAILHGAIEEAVERELTTHTLFHPHPQELSSRTNSAINEKGVNTPSVGYGEKGDDDDVDGDTTATTTNHQGDGFTPATTTTASSSSSASSAPPPSSPSVSSSCSTGTPPSHSCSSHTIKGQKDHLAGLTEVTNGFTLELCGGLVNKPSLSIREHAVEEIYEETGYVVSPDSLQLLSTSRESMGVSGSKSSIFYVKVHDSQRQSAGGGCAEEGEIIEVLEVKRDNIMDLLLLPTSSSASSTVGKRSSSSSSLPPPFFIEKSMDLQYCLLLFVGRSFESETIRHRHFVFSAAEEEEREKVLKSHPLSRPLPLPHHHLNEKEESVASAEKDKTFHIHQALERLTGGKSSSSGSNNDSTSPHHPLLVAPPPPSSSSSSARLPPNSQRMIDNTPSPSSTSSLLSSSSSASSSSSDRHSSYYFVGSKLRAFVSSIVSNGRKDQRSPNRHPHLLLLASKNKHDTKADITPPSSSLSLSSLHSLLVHNYSPFFSLEKGPIEGDRYLVIPPATTRFLYYSTVLSATFILLSIGGWWVCKKYPNMLSRFVVVSGSGGDGSGSGGDGSQPNLLVIAKDVPLVVSGGGGGDGVEKSTLNTNNKYIESILSYLPTPSSLFPSWFYYSSGSTSGGGNASDASNTITKNLLNVPSSSSSSNATITTTTTATMPKMTTIIRDVSLTLVRHNNSNINNNSVPSSSSNNLFTSNTRHTSAMTPQVVTIPKVTISITAPKDVLAGNL